MRSAEPLKERLSGLVAMAGDTGDARAAAEECVAIAESMRDVTAYEMFRFGQEHPALEGCAPYTAPPPATTRPAE